MNMVTPAMQLASKIPDVHVQLWATAILKGQYFLLISKQKLAARCCYIKNFVHITSIQYPLLIFVHSRFVQNMRGSK